MIDHGPNMRSALSTGAADALNNPAARRDDAELPCPEKRFEIIAAERCVQNTACPRAATCELRTIAIGLVSNARRPEIEGRPRVSGRGKGLALWRSRPCLICPRTVERDRSECCSPACTLILRARRRLEKTRAA